MDGRVQHVCALTVKRRACKTVEHRPEGGERESVDLPHRGAEAVEPGDVVDRERHRLVAERRL